MCLSIDPAANQENNKRDRSKYQLIKSFLKRIIILLSILTPLCILAGVVIIPCYVYHSKCVKHESQKTNSKRAHNKQNLLIDERILYEQKIRKLMRTMNQMDSLGIIIDFPDSVVYLVCKGIPLHACHVEHFSLSPSLRYYYRIGEIYNWGDTIFTAVNSIATIPKIPIKTKKAPKDSLSIDKETPKPDTRKEDIAVTIWFDNDLIIHMHQTDPLAINSIGSLLAQTIKELWENCSILLTIAMNRSIPHVAHTINISLNRDDCAILYRATPQKPKMVVVLQ